MVFVFDAWHCRKSAPRQLGTETRKTTPHYFLTSQPTGHAFVDHYCRRTGYSKRDYRRRIGARRKLGYGCVYTVRQSENRQGESTCTRLCTVRKKIIAKKLAKDLRDYIFIITFAVSTKERIDAEKQILFHLDLYNELKVREGAQKTLQFLADKIDIMVELLKEM